MKETVHSIGIVLEQLEDAKAEGRPLQELYHWREPEEIDSVTRALTSLGYRVALLGSPASLCGNTDRALAEIDFIFNISVGFTTRFRMAQGPALYELLGMPYSGADPYSKMVSQNKQLTKGLLDGLGISTPPWVFLQSLDDLPAADALVFPMIVKPAWEGASIGMDLDAVVHHRNDLRERVNRILENLRMPVIVEQFIVGRELKVGMIGHDPITFSGIIEDTMGDGAPLGDKFLYFDAKKMGSFSKRALNIADPAYARLVADCHRLYRTFAPLDYATFDIRVDTEGNHYFLEFNADATLHPRRTLAECCRLNGLPYDSLIKGILDSAFRRFNLAGPQALL
jgi:D-alanine-D-alanine ligase